jgi:hypothetical protein
MSNALKFAKSELDILIKSNTDEINRPIIEEFIPEILALVDKFGNSGQSGSSAPYVASAISNAVRNLCLRRSICPITGIDDEWSDVSNESDGDSNIMYQNKRCSALFKNSEGKSWYLDALVFENESGNRYSGRAMVLSIGEKIRCNQFIKGFPFEPKTFVINVIEKEISPDNFEFFIKDESQLEEVFKYYQPITIRRKVIIEKINNSLL